MKDPMRNDVPTMQDGSDSVCAVQGRVRQSPSKSLWWFAMAAGAVFALTTHFRVGALAPGLGTAAVTLCLGHSLSLRSCAAPLWMERLLHVPGLIGTLGGSVSAAYGINNSSQVVGG